MPMTEKKATVESPQYEPLIIEVADHTVKWIRKNFYSKTGVANIAVSDLLASNEQKLDTLSKAYKSGFSLTEQDIRQNLMLSSVRRKQILMLVAESISDATLNSLAKAFEEHSCRVEKACIPNGFSDFVSLVSNHKSSDVVLFCLEKNYKVDEYVLRIGCAIGLFGKEKVGIIVNHRADNKAIIDFAHSVDVSCDSYKGLGL